VAYGTEIHDIPPEYPGYDLWFDHPGTNTRIKCTIAIALTSGAQANEGTRDAIFQTLLTKIDEIPNTDLVLAQKRGMFITPVTP